MRILHIAPGCTFTESYKYQENLLTEYQAKHGHEVEILTTTLKNDTNGIKIDVGKEIKVLNNGVMLNRCFRINKFNKIIGIYPYIYRYICEFKPDLIFVHGLCTFAMNEAIKYKKKHSSTSIVADNHQDGGNAGDSGIVNTIEVTVYRTLWKKWINYVDKVYGTTSWRVTYANHIYGIPTEKLDLLLMGVDSDNMSSDCISVRKEIRKQLGIPEDAFVFVNGGQLNKHKLIVEALSEFNKLKNDSCYFIVFGSVKDDIKEIFRSEVDNNSHIIYLGFIDGHEIYKYLYASDFGVFPGRHSVIWEEAIGCGLPCMFKAYEHKDHLDICDNCVSVNNPTSEDIFSVMNRAVSDKDWYRLIKNNSEKAKDALSYHMIADKSCECAKDAGI